MNLWTAIYLVIIGTEKQERNVTYKQAAICAEFDNTVRSGPGIYPINRAFSETWPELYIACVPTIEGVRTCFDYGYTSDLWNDNSLWHHDMEMLSALLVFVRRMH